MPKAIQLGSYTDLTSHKFWILYGSDWGPVLSEPKIYTNYSVPYELVDFSDLHGHSLDFLVALNDLDPTNDMLSSDSITRILNYKYGRIKWVGLFFTLLYGAYIACLASDVWQALIPWPFIHVIMELVKIGESIRNGLFLKYF